ncbi:MAG: response regulator transcription factor [Bacteroidales bacterium]
MIIHNLLIKGQNFTNDLEYDLDTMHNNFESIACNNEQTLILVNHLDSTYTFYNYDKELYPLLGNNFSKADKDLFYKSLNEDVSFWINKYINIANSHFLDKRENNKCYYFIINYEYGEYGSQIGLSFKLIPILYTPNKSLVATLCILKRSQHIGKVTFEKYYADTQKLFVYDNTLKQFLEKEEYELTSEEIDILNLSGEGKKEKEIAEYLEIPLSRVKLIKNSIFDKLKVKTISEAIYISFKKGIIK